jgi:hypothetical protein
MSYRRSWIALSVVILGILVFIPVAQAERKDVELTQCSASTYNVVQSAPEIGIANYDQKGILMSTHENKIFDNWTFHLVGVQKRLEGKTFWNGFTKEMGPDGEFIIWEWTGDSESGTTGKAIYGTGKWKGIKGEGKSKLITSGKPIVPNTFQFCQKIVRWIELP